MKRTTILILALVALLGTWRVVVATGLESWSTTAASNNAAAPDGFPESMAPSGVNNAAREVMAQVRRLAQQALMSTWGPSGGGTNVYAVTPSIVWGSYVSGQTIRFRPNATNTGAATLDVSGLGALSIVTISGSTLTGLVYGDIAHNMVAEATYDGTHWILKKNGLADPLTTAGDIIYRNATVTTRLAIGVSGTNLTANASGLPAWLSPANIGTQTIWIPATAMVARTTSGATISSVELSTNKVMLRTLAYSATVDSFAQFTVAMPKSWNRGTLTAQMHWTTGSGSGDVIWGLQCLAVSNDDAMDAAFGTAATSTDTLLAANDNHLSPVTSGITCAGTPQQNDLTVWQIYRDADAGGDTLTADSALIGVKLFMTTGDPNDD